jgi:hypothetical protein
MNWSAADGQEIGPNDRSVLQAIDGTNPLPTLLYWLAADKP